MKRSLDRQTDVIVTGDRVQNFKLQREQNRRLNRTKPKFPQNPQAQQQQGIDNLKYKDCSDERCGNVGKVEKIHGCPRQVFVDQEVAESTARALLAVGIVAVPETCRQCSRIHLKENRHNAAINRATIHSLLPRFA